MSNAQERLDHIRQTKCLLVDMVRHRVNQYMDLYSDGLLSILPEERELCQLSCLEAIDEMFHHETKSLNALLRQEEEKEERLYKQENRTIPALHFNDALKKQEIITGNMKFSDFLAHINAMDKPVLSPHKGNPGQIKGMEEF